jgi:hypothetical protein
MKLIHLLAGGLACILNWGLAVSVYVFALLWSVVKVCGVFRASIFQIGRNLRLLQRCFIGYLSF